MTFSLQLRKKLFVRNNIASMELPEDCKLNLVRVDSLGYAKSLVFISQIMNYACTVYGRIVLKGDNYLEIFPMVILCKHTRDTPANWLKYDGPLNTLLI